MKSLLPTEPRLQTTSQWAASAPRGIRPSNGISQFRTEALCYFLRNAKVFQRLSEESVRDLAESAVLKTLEKGDYLFHKNEAAPGLYLVRRGIINLHRIAMDGREVVIHFYREGEMLAETGSEEIGGCPADACAVMPSEVVMIPWRVFVEKSRLCPELLLRLISSFDQQIHQFADSFEDFVSTSSVTRFVQWLLRRCDDQESCAAVEIDLGTTKRTLANELGIRQETLSRTLRQLTDSGHLVVDGRHITVKNPKALRSAWQSVAACAEAA